MSSEPATMAEAAGSVPAPLHRGIPDEIAVWEILVRLPPEAVLRCRAVCPAWRRATSTRDFLLAHHARQPTLPLLCVNEYGGGNYWHLILTFDHQAAAAAEPTLPIVDGYNSAGVEGMSVDIIPLQHRTGLLSAEQLQPVTRLASRDMDPEASCDGLLIHAYGNNQLSICNPATHQYAPLPQLYGFKLLGMYPHSPTGEYRLLLRQLSDLQHADQFASYVFTLGSGQSPRYIGNLEAQEVISTSSVLFGGNLHWHIEQKMSLSENPSNMIVVFDTTAEVFRQMHAPAVPGEADLFEMGDMLGMASFNRARTIIDIWVMQDYESEVWTFKCRIELPVEEFRMQCVHYRRLGTVVVVHVDGELLVLVKIEDWLHHVDINGKLVASFHRRGLGPTQLQLKQTLVLHTFFPTLEGYVVNESPFI